jgi:hypothetical protein
LARKRKPTARVKVSPEAQARANERLRQKWSRPKKGIVRTPPEAIKKLIDNVDKLPRSGKAGGKAKAKVKRAEDALARRTASDTSPGKAKPVPRGKKRGTGGGRMTRGS